MKAHPTLRHAIMHGLTLDQQAELTRLITDMAEAAKEYGFEASRTISGEAFDDATVKVNTAWLELRDIGLPVSF